MSRVQHFLRSVFSPFNIVVFVGVTVFAAVDVVSWRGANYPNSAYPPAKASTHGGPTNTPTNTGTWTPTPTTSPSLTPTHTFTPMNTPTESPTVPPTPSGTPSPYCSPQVLFDQMAGGLGTNGTASQDFEAANNAYDAEAADDYTLGSGEQFVVQKVIARGLYFNGSGPADSFNVTFYYPGSTPSIVRRVYTGLNYTQDGDRFIIDIPNDSYCCGGWVSVQARMDFTPGGQWAWADREQLQFLTPATWKNPGGGLSVPQCSNFAQRGATCNIDPAYPDQAFQIIGFRPAGGCTVPPAAAISGTVTYGNAIPPATRPVSNVLLSGAGSVAVSATTGSAGGDYLLSGFGSGSYTVTPTKSGGVNNITSFDAARISQHVVSVNPLMGNQLVVADVSGNGTISSFDAGEIARYVAAVSGSGATGNWIFSPVNRSYASVTSNISGENYSALLMGEVSGNWMNTGARPESSRLPENKKPEIVVAVPEVFAEAGKEILVPVNVRGAANNGLISYEFDLRYDPNVVQPLSEPVDLAGTASRSLSAVTNVEEPGLLRVVIYGAFPIDQDGALLNLKFRAVGVPGAVSPLTWEHIVFNEGEYRTNAIGGTVGIVTAVSDQAPK